MHQNSVMTFFLLTLLHILFLLFLILSTAITLLSRQTCTSEVQHFSHKISKPLVLTSSEKLKLLKRRLERVWSASHSSEDLRNFRSATNLYHAAIIKAKKACNSSLISYSITNPRHLWKSINTILHRSSLPALPTYDSLSSLLIPLPIFFSFFLIRFTNFIPVFC